MKTDLSAGLNDEQRSAVECIDGPVLIVAGAGSGKTRVLTCRIANMLEKGVEASGILALTFTKKAAGEMKDRITGMVGSQKSRKLVMGTFHSVFARFLREYAPQTGYPESFTIYDTSDSLSAIKACIKELSLDEKVYRPKEVLSRISMAKNNLVTSAAYRANSQLLTSDRNARKPLICDIYSLYDKKCRASGVMDFDDLLLNANILLRDCPAAYKELSSRFTHILVDEYQDTNVAQYIILKKLSASHHNICVVGDDSQSIYAFRGARIENILNFKKDYPECRTFRLERNYRSTKTIVGAANSLIANNEGRIPKECYSEGDEGEKISVLKGYTEAEEAALIVDALCSRVRTDGAAYKDFAVLYRTNSQSRALEEALRRRNIPYRIYSGNSFFERAEVKDVMAYFKLAVNPGDDESFKRVVNKPARGIGDTSLGILASMAASKGLSFMDLLGSCTDTELLEAGLRGAAIGKVRAFTAMMLGFSATAASDDAYGLGSRILSQSGLYAYYKADTSVEGLSRTANVDELVNSISVFVENRQGEVAEASEVDDIESLPVVTLGEFIENVALLSNVDISEDEDGDNKVSLMTVHSSKGLEYPHVFVAGMEENLFPGGGSLASPSEIEEERRLFYVALTRAGVTVTLSYAGSRMRNGEHKSNAPSRFLEEIDSRFYASPSMLYTLDNQRTARPGGFSGYVPTSGSYSNTASGYVPKFGSYRYGASGEVRTERRSATASLRPRQEDMQKYRDAAALGRASVLHRELPPKVSDAEFVPEPMTAFKVGDRVEHNRFGGGKILEITGAVPELKARIAFDDYGLKVILLKYAKMRFE